jgi:developmental checkpoint coupling sporulation initiation to replication initiation
VKYLSDQMLIEVYHRAVDLQLDPAFIELLSAEIKRRDIGIAQVVSA